MRTTKKLEAQMIDCGAIETKIHKKKKKKSKRKDEVASVALCWEFGRKGSCRFGNKCKFKHQKTATKDCRYGVSCHRKECRFKHPEQSVSNIMCEDEESEESECETTSDSTGGISTIDNDVNEDEDSYDSESSEVEFMAVSYRKLALINTRDWSVHFWWDSGCTKSQTFDRSLFSYYEKYTVKKNTVVGDMGKVPIVGWGIVATISKSTGVKMMLRMDHVPKLGFTLVSDGQLARKGINIKRTGDLVEFNKEDQVIMTATPDEKIGLYLLDLEVIKIDDKKAKKWAKEWKMEERYSLATSEDCSELELMHRRMGHLNTRDLLYMCKQQLIQGGPTLEKTTYRTAQEIIKECEVCKKSKPMRTKKLNTKKSKTTKKLKSKEPLSTDEKRGDRKIVTLSTDFCGPLNESILGNRYVCVSIAKELGFIFVKCLPHKTDVIGVVEEFKSFLESYGMNVRRHESDDGGEFREKKLTKYCKEKGIELYYGSGYDSNANAKAERGIRTVFDTTRCIMCQSQLPDIFRDFAFRFSGFIRNMSYSRWRRSIPYTEVTGQKPDLKHVYTFGALSWARKPKKKYGKLEARQVKCIYLGPGGMMTPKRKGAVFLELEGIQDGMKLQEVQFTTRRYDVKETSFIDLSTMLFRSPGLVDKQPSEAYTTNEIKTEDSSLRRSSRRKRRRLITEEDFGMMCLLNIDVNKALSGENREEWKTAMESEINSIIDTGTRTLVRKEKVEKIKNKNKDKVKIFNTKFVLDFKEFEKRYKARLVVTSWMWKESRKDEFYSPVVEESTFFLLLNISVMNKWKIWSWDAKNAFLHGVIPEEYLIYVKPPAGIDDGYLWKLNKALYGLPISSKLWYENVRNTMVKAGWIQSRFDKCCFFQKKNSRLLGLLVVHVDDFQVTGDEQTIMDLREILFETYNMKSVDFTRYCGINIHRPQEHGAIFIDMKDYIEKLYEKFGEPTLRNMPYRASFIKNIEPGEEKDRLMREITGSLLFVSKVRPEIKYAVSVFCSMNDKYNEVLLQEAKKIVGYLMKTKDERLVINPTNMKLTAILDADFAGCKLTRKSRNGMLYLLGGSYLLARSKKQSCNTDSSTYAETKCLVDGCKWIIYFRNFLKELNFEQLEPTEIHQDNIQTIRIIENEGNQEKARGFDINYHQVQDYLRRRKISLTKTESRKMLVDALNKPVGKNIFNEFKRYIGIRKINSMGGSEKTCPGELILLHSNLHDDQENVCRRGSATAT